MRTDASTSIGVDCAATSAAWNMAGYGDFSSKASSIDYRAQLAPPPGPAAATQAPFLRPWRPGPKAASNSAGFQSMTSAPQVSQALGYLDPVLQADPDDTVGWILF